MSFLKKITKSVSKVLPSAGVGAGAGFLVGGPVGALVGAGAGGLLAYSQDQAIKAQNKANKQAIADANAYDMYTWDLANQYNDPVHQMERLKKAGLNPNLVYGSGNVTGNTTGVAHSNGAVDYGVFNQADTIAQALPIAQSFANLENTQAQNQLLNYQMGQTQAQTQSIIANTRNLNNFLDGTGRSTYDPIVQKNIEGVVSSMAPRLGSKFYNHLTRPSTSSDTNYFRSASEWVGDTAWKIGNWFSNQQSKLRR